MNDRLVIRDYPITLWIFGLAALGFGILWYSQDSTQFLIPAVCAAICMVVVLLSSVLTVTADHLTGLVTLKYSSLVRRKTKDIPISEIASIDLERSRSYSSNSSGSYRIVIQTRDGKSLPFHPFYTSGSMSMNAKARRLREYLGVRGSDQSLGGTVSQGLQMVQQHLQESQVRLTGSEIIEHVKDGIHWRVQTVSLGSTPVTRWFSADYQCPGNFVFLPQKVTGQKSLVGGLLGGVGKLLFQQTVKLYGFSPDDTPNLDSGEVLASLDENLEPHFSVFTSDPVAAQHILNPWTIAPLVDWGKRYPLKQVQQKGLFGQLVVLFSPQGVYLANLGTMIPEAVEELSDLGVALLKELKGISGEVS